MSDLSDRTTVVVGASRGLGRGIARAFAEAGAPVVAVARTGPALAELATTSVNIRTEVADAADATVAWSLLDQYEPEVLILVASANPVMRPLQYQTWETFSVNWHTDVKIAFTWQQGGGGEQRICHQRITGQRRVRRVQGHPAVHLGRFLHLRHVGGPSHSQALFGRSPILGLRFPRSSRSNRGWSFKWLSSGRRTELWTEMRGTGMREWRGCAYHWEGAP